jgi:charged multivesicular body protein 3
MFKNLFGKKEAPKPKTFDQMNAEEMKEFQGNMRKEIREAVREVDKQIWQSDRLIMESKRDLEKKIKENADRNTLKTYAQNVMRAQGVKDKHLVQKTKVQQIEFSVNEMIMNIKMSKTMGLASNMMAKINGLADIPEISKNVQNMQMQMEKMGIVGEMVDDAMDAMGDDDIDLDDKAQNLLDEMEAKHNPAKKIKNTNQTQKDDLDAQLKRLAE